MAKIKIAIVGLGGVGGFYGGLLANQYENDPNIEVNFLVRGANLEAIKETGLTVYSKNNVCIGRPTLATDKGKDIGVVDFILLCTKAYDLDGAIALIDDMIGEQTIVIPLLNGVSPFKILQEKLSNTEVWQGCTYMVSRLEKPGVINNPSGRQRILFGLEGVSKDKMFLFEDILKKAGIKAEVSIDINTEVWEKYILVSSSAMATSYFDCSIGFLMQNHPYEVKRLIQEATNVALACKVQLSDNIVKLVIERLEAIPYESTTSMHSDFKAKNTENELEIMGGFLLQEGKNHDIQMPYYKLMYDELKLKKSTY